MSGQPLCSEIKNRSITRAVITYLENIKDKKFTVRQAVYAVGNLLNCEVGDKDSEEYEKIKERLKKALESFNFGIKSSEWKDFKKKYEKRIINVPDIEEVEQIPTAPTILTQSSGGLSGVSSKDLRKLADMCKGNKTKVDIEKALRKLGISKIQNKALNKIRKGDLCDAISASAPLSPKQAVPATAVIPSGPSIDMDKCDTRTNTIDQLKKYIAGKGWPAPPSKATKAKICAYIESMESKTKPPSPIIPSLAKELAAQPTVEPEFPAGYDDCSNPRGILTKPKIKNWVMSKGWHLEPTFPGFPSDKKDKGTWCTFLANLISSHPLVVEQHIPSVIPTTIPTVEKPPIYTDCYETGEWKTAKDVENELASCPSNQVCNISKRKCISEEDAKVKGWPYLNVNLKTGRTTTLYAENNETIDKIRPMLQDFIQPQITPSKSKQLQFVCGTLENGTRNELLSNLECPSDQVCDLNARKCSPLMPGQIKLTLHGKDVIGSAEKINELKRKLEPQTSAIPTSINLQPKIPSKAKVSFKPGQVVYGEEERKRQTEATKMLSQLIGEPASTSKKPISKVKTPIPSHEIPSTPEIVKPQKTAESIQAPIVAPIIEEPSAVARLIGRLRDLQVQPSQPPIKLIRAESNLNKAINACVGISS